MSGWYGPILPRAFPPAGVLRRRVLGDNSVQQSEHDSRRARSPAEGSACRTTTFASCRCRTSSWSSHRAAHMSRTGEDSSGIARSSRVLHPLFATTLGRAHAARNERSRRHRLTRGASHVYDVYNRVRYAKNQPNRHQDRSANKPPYAHIDRFCHRRNDQSGRRSGQHPNIMIKYNL